MVYAYIAVVAKGLHISGGQAHLGEPGVFSIEQYFCNLSRSLTAAPNTGQARQSQRIQIGTWPHRLRSE